MRRAALATLLGLSLAATSLAAAPVQAAPTQSKLAQLVTLKNVRHHQLNLQKIADANGGNRAAGLPGHVITVKYLADQLKRAGYAPKVQKFGFDFWQERSEPTFAQTEPDAKTFEPGTDYRTMQYSGAGDVTAAASPVDPGATGLGSGCEADDFNGFPKGHIALIQRGGCLFALKTDNAIAAGAAAVVIYQLPTQPGPVAGTLGKPYGVPVIGPTNALGRALVEQAQNGGVTLRVRTDTLSEKREAANVIADTDRGKADNIVVVGAHNDSVAEGPGINDNASGTAAVLELAKQIRKLNDKQLRNKVRFAFWGAEEEGLLGSQYYVDSLSQAERDKIALNLNFDMIGSPNYVRFVYDGDNSTGASNVPPPAGSGAIEKAFTDYFAQRKLATDESAFDGRSDYNAFISVGIPAGGLATGAEGIKTAEQARVYGGTAGQAYDPCYHSVCDRYENVHLQGLDEMTDGAAAITQFFAHSTLTVNGNELTRRQAPARLAPPSVIGSYATR
ncbi:M20/M25/M40 family metallo-hydrolase [Actinomadura spongiicola]|uniref:M20/M25/M40 family metallo-hydrolase n=1 Tax=Actinomadura spongiicola TaxID=2303421 RepID=A0A372GGF3_9ACTN|nr:M20/M25/M40 family metallo-hydrolase [Actinomadura spongiicola]RFS84262.1 M20/M25/M40 family metallo-hydrolase [Actinomadura spongiicola]